MTHAVCSALVAEVMLFSEGFEDSKVLSRKMVQMYKLASEQLSQQVRLAGCCGQQSWEICFTFCPNTYNAAFA